MQTLIIDFIQALRHHGLPISPAETLDAVSACAAINIDNKQQLKNALTATLAKSALHQNQLQRLFDDFFDIPKVDVPGVDAPQPQSDNTDSLPATRYSTQAIQSPLGQQLLTSDATQLHLSMMSAAEIAGVQNIKVFLQKKLIGNRILLQMGDRELRQELQLLKQKNIDPKLLHELNTKRHQLIDSINNYVEQQFILFSSQTGKRISDQTLAKVKLSHIDSVKLQQLQRLIEKTAKKLASLHSRQRKVSQRGQLHMRNTIAANAAFDGHLLHTRWKSTKVDRPKVIVICDVSGSVSIYAKFLLLFVCALQAVLPRVRSFVFSNHLAEVTQALKESEPAEALEAILNRWSHYSTDYGRALLDFEHIALPQVDNKTQVIMLGDARNNYDKGQATIWQQVYNRAQRVLWLNPEDKSLWNTGDSIMQEYAPYCSSVEQCANIKDLERIFSRLLRCS